MGRISINSAPRFNNNFLAIKEMLAVPQLLAHQVHSDVDIAGYRRNYRYGSDPLS